MNQIVLLTGSWLLVNPKKGQWMDIRNWTRAKIMEYINESCMAGLVPSDFKVAGENWITFTPRQAFWNEWNLNRNYLLKCGCRVYAIRDYRPKRDEWRCELMLSMLPNINPFLPRHPIPRRKTTGVPEMPKNFNYYKIGAVAYLFITEPDKTVKEIADAVGVRENTVHQWQAKGEWDKALDGFNFTGDRSLRRKASRDLERDSSDRIALAESTYRYARAAGMNKGQASKHTAKIVNVSEKTIFNWRKRFGWDE